MMVGRGGSDGDGDGGNDADSIQSKHIVLVFCGSFSHLIMKKPTITTEQTNDLERVSSNQFYSLLGASN